jgi:hypothetical protein
MALVDNKITTYAKSIANLSDTPNSDGLTASQLKAFFDGRTNEEVKTSINGIIDALSATTDSESGADQIGATALKVGGAESVQGQLEELKAEKVDKVAGKELSTNDYDNTEKAKVTANTLARHTHDNKALLDTYAQTETNLADAVSKKHSHSNKTLLDTYAQTEVNLADAVAKKHSHANKALLDSYTQTEANIADAVSKKHTHANKTALDGIAEVTQVLGSATNKVPSEKAVVDALSSSGYGDMLKAVYDPTNKATDIFDYADTKIAASLATAADQALVSTGVGAWAVKTLAQIKTWLGLKAAAFLDLDVEGGVASHNALATHTAEHSYLQEEEPTNVNPTTLWFAIGSEANFSGGGVSIQNAETSVTPPETNIWFEPV